jgi:hypothetical protein
MVYAVFVNGILYAIHASPASAKTQAEVFTYRAYGHIDVRETTPIDLLNGQCQHGQTNNNWKVIWSGYAKEEL